MGFPKDLVASGDAFTPTPCDIAHELWYWSEPEQDLDIALPMDWILYHKLDRLNFAVDSISIIPPL